MTTQHDDAMLDLVATYAIGAVDATTGECTVVRSHIAECPSCQHEFMVARAATAALGLSAAEAPPAALRQRILASLPGTTAPLIMPRAKRASWLLPLAAAAAIVIAAGVWWNAHRPAPQSWAATCTPGNAACHASGTVTATRFGLHVQINGLAALPAGKQYQAWMIPPGGAPKPEPVFSADESGAGSVDMPEAPLKGALVAITVEPAGGSQQPTSKPFLVAKID
jgi:anti-sigma-K factor RskA